MLKPGPGVCGGVVTVMVMLALAPPAWAVCGESGVALQVLGSSGPRSDGRASAGYLIWIDGVARIMVDAGGGTFARFGEAGARMPDVQLLALSHFHPDHATEVPALLWPGGGSLRIAGPSGNAAFPSVDDFLAGLVGSDGVFRVLSARLTLAPVTVNVAASDPFDVFTDGPIRVRGIGVPHGNVPTVGYRVDVGDASVAFSSDQNGSDPTFVEFVRGVDVLIVHFAASEDVEGFAAELHAKPSVWGQMARDAGVGTLVLSHRAADIEASVRHLRSRYDGPLVVADDLMCVPVE